MTATTHVVCVNSPLLSHHCSGDSEDVGDRARVRVRAKDDR